MKKIPPESPIYRAVSKKWWIKNDIISPSAFLLRRESKDGTPERELSVNTTADCSKEICIAGLKDCYGELKLIADKIRDIKLDVVPKPLPFNKYHAVIINLLLYTEETIKEAERMAGLLAKQVISIQRRAN